MDAHSKGLPGVAPSVKPKAVEAYFDNIGVWFPTPNDASTLGKLRKKCGSGGLRVENRQARFDRNLCQRIEMRQPTACALNWLADRDGILVNRIEVALDWTFGSRADRDDAFEFHDRHLCRRWHGSTQEIRDFRGTRYDAGKWAPNRWVVYPQEYSRLTGEIDVLHAEWRANGIHAVRALGVLTAADLIDFDYRTFWRQRLLLLDIDRDRLGRLVRNRAEGSKSRFSTASARRTGAVIANGYATMQQLIDSFRGSVRIERALIRLDNTEWLPPRGPDTLVIYPNETPTRTPAIPMPMPVTLT